MAWFNKHYECPCGATWSDEWSCECNDRCPDCNKEIEAYDSDDLTIIMDECANTGAFLVLRSPPDAEDDPRYQLVAEFPVAEWTRGWAEYAAELLRQSPDDLSQEDAESLIAEQVVDKCRRRGVNTRHDPIPTAG